MDKAKQDDGRYLQRRLSGAQPILGAMESIADQREGWSFWVSMTSSMARCLVSALYFFGFHVGILS